MSRGTILAVGKDAAQAGLCGELLAADGYEVVPAQPGEEALSLARQRPWDIVVFDAGQASTTDLEALSALKAAAPGRDVIVLYDPHSDPAVLEALGRGAAGSLARPGVGQELQALVRDTLGRQATARECSRLASENALLAEQARAHERGLELLALPDAARIVDHLLDLLIAGAEAVWAALFLRDTDGGRFDLAGRRGVCDLRLALPDTTFQTEELRERFGRGRALFEDAEGRQSVDLESQGGCRFRVPLLAEGTVIGMAVVGPRRDDAWHGARPVALARTVAAYGAAALVNARRLERESGRDIRDPLTGACSPAFFHQAGAKEVSIARRYGRALSAVVVQLDTYPAVKATLKEEQARRLLRQFSGKLLEIARETDLVAMIEEGVFGIVVPETDYYGALMLIKRLRAALRQMAFAPDLSRQITLRASMGAASHPRDGDHLPSILRRARERLAQDRTSVVRAVGLGDRPFWEAFTLLLDLGARPERPPLGEHLTLADPELDQLRDLLLEEAGRLGAARGLLYVADRVVESAAFAAAGLQRLAGSKISVFCLGARGAGGWSHPEVTPVYLADERIVANRFLLCVTERSSYTCLCRPEAPGRWRAFHSADPHLALDLVSKLQERYLLQQRVG